MADTWKASSSVINQMESIKSKNHSQLKDASIAIAFSDSKPFVKNRFNWGKVSKFSNFNKIWQAESHDFCIVLCGDVWHSILSEHQREALLDLHLSRCQVEYMPEIIVENKKKEVVKDEWGRIKYTNDVKYDDDGNPKWFVAPLDLIVFTNNISRYGLWCEDLTELKLAWEDHDEE